MKYLLRAGQFLGKYKWHLIVGFLSLLIADASSLLLPQFTRRIVDTGIASADIQILLWMSLAMVGLAAVRGAFSFTQGVLMARTAQGLAYDIRNRLYDKIQSLSFSYHDRAQTGQLMTRATSDVDMVQGFIGQGLLMVISSALMMIGSLVFLFVTNWRLSLVMIVIVPLTFVIFSSLSKRLHPMFMQVQQRLAKLNTVLQESLVGVRVVKAFAREPFEAQRYAAANQELYDINIHIGRLMASFFPLIFLFSNISSLSVYWIGGAQVIGGELTLGEMLAFANYVMMAFWPMMTVTMIITMLSQAGASAERIFEILDVQSEVLEKPGAPEMPPLHGEVAFENVSFRYFGKSSAQTPGSASQPDGKADGKKAARAHRAASGHGGHPGSPGGWAPGGSMPGGMGRPGGGSSDLVLDQVSFEAKPGQVIALLGATGSGKSTIINLLPRFYDVTDGRVLVDGIDVRDVTLTSLRSQIGIVFQETILFAGTIKENIAFGRSDATMDEIVAAAQAAEAHDFITSFPEGYETQVGERGVTLSGGQKQRIAIARALLMNPHILILDDSTSSVDLETEYRIQKALDRLMEGRTSFVIAHRIATVLNADQILVLDKGKIVARGVHEELMRDSEIYAQIYSSQLLQDAVLKGEPTPAEVGGIE